MTVMSNVFYGVSAFSNAHNSPGEVSIRCYQTGGRSRLRTGHAMQSGVLTALMDEMLQWMEAEMKV